ncbi:MAG: N-acetylmuramoyl-L-alanine amidase [Corynebacterium sp.]|uniref:N-acetylmuramoyl-L-alanine amidase n=1 Tax=Corynebacterium sp. TaxID=1720 RepID=UPI0026DBC4BA|nr:N-acetylmuramoyl-L-alanine amidase [Corynebacterium sp.]MDO5030950.1 N-acetylmuramoyl-L-alanine amidase [Corynebacterium sp.]
MGLRKTVKFRTSAMAVALATAAALPLGLAGCTIDKDGQALQNGQPQLEETQSAQVNEEMPMSNEQAMPNPTPGEAPNNAAQAPEANAANAVGRDNPVQGSLAGKIIYLDPGHAGTPPPADLMVTDGRGGQKPCNTSGTSSNDGFPEHQFNWLIAQDIKQLLEERGANVLLSRADDTGRADCIDARAEKENQSNADAVVSLHADGAGEGNRGFHVSAISQPLPNNDAEGSTALAQSLRDAMVSAGFAPSNYLGADGLNPRADLTGLNLSTRPKALVEFGNMRDSADLALLTSDTDRRRMAEAIVAGLEQFVAH